jgi:hypothetical protein
MGQTVGLMGGGGEIVAVFSVPAESPEIVVPGAAKVIE